MTRRCGLKVDMTYERIKNSGLEVVVLKQNNDVLKHFFYMLSCRKVYFMRKKVKIIVEKVQNLKSPRCWMTSLAPQQGYLLMYSVILKGYNQP